MGDYLVVTEEVVTKVVIQSDGQFTLWHGDAKSTGTMAAFIRSTARRHATRVLSRGLSTHVSVIGLHWKTDKTRLREAFSPFGKLEKAELITPAHSSMHLWAQLEYAEFDEALKAVIEMNGQELDGRLLRVSITDPTKKDDEDSEESAETK